MLRLILRWLNLKKMDIENLIAVFERKLILQRYSDGSIKNYSSSVRSFLQVAEKRFDQPDELNENEIEKYVYRKIRTILAVPISDLQMCCFVRGLFILSFFSFSVFYRPCRTVRQTTMKSDFIIVYRLNFSVWENLSEPIINFLVFVFLCFKYW